MGTKLHLFKTKLTQLQNHVHQHEDDVEQTAVYRLCKAIIKEELEAIREEMRGRMTVYAPDEQQRSEEKIKFGIFKATDVEEIFNAYLNRIDDGV